MKRLILTLLVSLSTTAVYADENFPEFKFGGLLDFRLVKSDDTVSWMDNGLGKTRYGADANGSSRSLGRLAGAALVMSSRFSWDYKGHLVLKYDPEQKDSVDVLEGFVSYAPIATSSYRFKSRIGAFFPPVSLENKGVAWTSPYTITPSAINSWVGEEIKILGAEASLLKMTDENRYSLTAAVYKANDPTGSLLAYRGWAMNDRVTGINDRVPLANITPFQAGNAFAGQVPWVEPVGEMDGDWGYYLSAKWNYLDMSEFRALYYDNRADPSIFDGEQYAWHTRFSSLGAKFELEDDVDILAQYMMGSTLMGVGPSGIFNAIDNDFSSFYLLISKRYQAHRFTLRYDSFKVEDIDNGVLVPYDLNEEDGDAWTLAYTLRMKRKYLLMLEAMRVASERPARAQIGAPVNIEELQLQLSYRVFL